MNDIQQAIYDFIKERFEIGDDPDFTPDVHLFDSGFVDSLGAIEIVDFAEEHWHIEHAPPGDNDKELALPVDVWPAHLAQHGAPKAWLL